MYYKSGNTLIKSGTTYFKQVVKTLTFQVEGDRFPIGTNAGTGTFYLGSSVNQNVTVNWGDGVIESYSMQSFGSTFRLGFRAPDNSTQGDYYNPHIFQDGFTGTRNITFEFSDFSELTIIDSLYAQLSGSFPVEIVYANNLQRIYLNGTQNLNPIPDEVINVPSLREFEVSNAFAVTPSVIPNGVFNSQLERLAINGFILTDNTISNFFLINQLRDTLESFFAVGSQIEELPDELFECTLIDDLRLDNNQFQRLDERLNQLTQLTRLYFGVVDVSVNSSLPDFNNLVNLSALYLQHNDTSGSGFNYSDIVTNWVGLKSLSSFILFQQFCRTSAQLNAFIPYFYQLCVENGFIDPNSQAAIASGYPNQFRGISWGHSSLTVDSPVVAPTGFVQGVSNGTPTTNGERVYVLMANYSHVTPY